jgi:hypothetical protein
MAVQPEPALGFEACFPSLTRVDRHGVGQPFAASRNAVGVPRPDWMSAVEYVLYVPIGQRFPTGTSVTQNRAKAGLAVVVAIAMVAMVFYQISIGTVYGGKNGPNWPLEQGWPLLGIEIVIAVFCFLKGIAGVLQDAWPPRFGFDD